MAVQLPSLQIGVPPRAAGVRWAAGNVVLYPGTNPAGQGQLRVEALAVPGMTPGSTVRRPGRDFLRRGQVLGLGRLMSNCESEQEELPHNRSPRSVRQTRLPYVSPCRNRPLQCTAVALRQAGCSPPTSAKPPAGGQVLLVLWLLHFFPPLAQATKTLSQQPGVPSWGGDGARQDPGEGGGGIGPLLSPLAWAPGAARWLLMPQGAAWGQRVEKPTSAELKLRRGDLRAPT